MANAQQAAVILNGEFLASIPCSMNGYDRPDYHERVVSPAKKALINRFPAVNHFRESFIEHDGKRFLVIDGYKLNEG